MGKIIDLLDGALVDIKDDCYYEQGCPTCDWGSVYAKEFEFVLTKYIVRIEASEMYDYPELSVGDVIRLLVNLNYDNMTEQDFCETVKDSFSAYADEKNYGIEINIIDKKA